MNCSVYFFGELSSGYTQYPEDSSSHVLKKIYPFCKAPTQIAIRRDASMMYYCYIRKLNDNKYFGLSIAVNGYYISRVNELFSLFENIIEKIAQQGSFIHFAKDGSLTTSTTILKNEEEEIDTLSENLRRGFEALGSSTNILPQVDYTVAKDSVKEFNALDDKNDIVRASYTYGYTFIYKDKDYNTVRLNSYRSILSQLNNKYTILKKENENLSSQLAKEKLRQKNIKWVFILIIVVFFFGVVIWNKVLFPSEVTRFQTKEFIYYGPIKDNKPHGIGVAIYPNDDKAKRLYYYGNFTDGIRNDTAAVLFYQDGSYFKGEMYEDSLKSGIMFSVDKEHFIGTFRDNEPWTGEWFKHVKVQKLRNGINVR